MLKSAPKKTAEVDEKMEMPPAPVSKAAPSKKASMGSTPAAALDHLLGRTKPDAPPPPTTQRVTTTRHPTVHKSRSSMSMASGFDSKPRPPPPAQPQETGYQMPLSAHMHQMQSQPVDYQPQQQQYQQQQQQQPPFRPYASTPLLNAQVDDQRRDVSRKREQVLLPQERRGGTRVSTWNNSHAPLSKTMPRTPSPEAEKMAKEKKKRAPTDAPSKKKKGKKNKESEAPLFSKKAASDDEAYFSSTEDVPMPLRTAPRRRSIDNDAYDSEASRSPSPMDLDLRHKGRAPSPPDAKGGLSGLMSRMSDYVSSKASNVRDRTSHLRSGDRAHSRERRRVGSRERRSVDRRETRALSVERAELPTDRGEVNERFFDRSDDEDIAQELNDSFADVNFESEVVPANVTQRTRTTAPPIPPPPVPRSLGTALNDPPGKFAPQSYPPQSQSSYAVPPQPQAPQQYQQKYRQQYQPPQQQQLQPPFPPAPQPPTMPATGRYRVDYSARLGQGGFGVVYKGFDNITGTVVAVKEALITGGAGVAAELSAEFKTLTQLQHPNVVRVLHFGTTEDKTSIVMEWMPSGSVHSLLHDSYFRLHEFAVRRYLRDACAGLRYLHENKVLHRDIKPGNMLVAADGAVKLSDFGTSRQIEAASAGTTATTVGTACFLSPEALRVGKYSFASDVWALAASAIEMSTGELPWAHLPEGQRSGMPLLFFIGTAQPPNHHPRIPGHLSAALRQLLERCFAFDPADRPTAADLCADPYFGAATDSDLGPGSETLEGFGARQREALVGLLEAMRSGSEGGGDTTRKASESQLWAELGRRMSSDETVVIGGRSLSSSDCYLESMQAAGGSGSLR